MRRVLTRPAAAAAGLGRGVVEGWRCFFFTPADPLVVGVIRLGVGALLAWDLAVLGLDLGDLLGPDGWIGPEANAHYLAEHTPGAWSAWFAVPDRWLPAAWAAALGVAVLFALGWWSRLAAVLAWAVAVSTVRRMPVALFGFDHTLTTWLFYLAAFGASGQALSLDRLAQIRRGRGATFPPDPAARPTVGANLTLRMIQLHLALIYGSAGLAKLMAPDWWDGTAMEVLILTPEFRRFDLTWLLDYPGLLRCATYLGVGFELAYPVLIWFRRLRLPVIAAAVAMHLSIDLMLGLTEFGLAMIVANLAFAPADWFRSPRAKDPEDGMVAGAGAEVAAPGVQSSRSSSRR